MRISTTKINTFLWCKRQYQLKYIDKLPVVSTPLMDRGIYVHALLSAYVKGIEPPVPSNPDIVESAKIMFNNAIKVFKPKKSGLSEIEVSRPYKDDIIMGIIDYFDNDTLIDFKAIDKPKNYRSPLQLAIYRYLIGQRKEYRYLHIWEKGTQWLTYTDKDLNFYDEIWQEAIEEIKSYEKEYTLAGIEFPTRKTRFCKQYCSFYPICFKGISFEEYKNKIKEAI